MTAIIRLEWPLDLRGYEVVDSRTDDSAPQIGGLIGEEELERGRFIVPRGDESSLTRYVLHGTDDSIFKEIANTPQTEEGVLALVNKRGLLTRMPRPEISNVCSHIKDLRAALMLIEQGDLSELERTMERRGIGPLRLRFGRVGRDSTPRVYLEPVSLLHFAHLEIMQIVGRGVKVQSCLFCGDFFPIQRNKGSRSTKQYCTDSCRLKMHRKQKKDRSME